MSLGERIYKYLAIFSLFACVLIPFKAFFSSPADYPRNFELYRTWFNTATLIWFFTAPVWLIPQLFQRGPDPSELKGKTE